MDVRHGFLECYPGYWVRIDAIHQVCKASNPSMEGVQSAVYAGGAEKDNGGGVFCTLAPEEVMALVEQARSAQVPPR